MKMQGIFPALTSSFDYEGKLYKAKVFHNIERLNQIALSGYVVCGSTGETPLLAVSERIQLMEWVREASAEGKTLIAGVGAESVHETVQIANRAAEIGFHAALALTPFYYRNQMHRPETQALYFRAVADRSKIPVLIYNIPQVTGYDVPVDTVAELSEHPNIVGMKDSSGNLERMNEVVRMVKPGFQVLSGSGISFWEALQIGASGAILAIANVIPYACVTIWEAFRTREQEAGHDWQMRITPPSRLIAAKYGIPGLKYAMDLNGYYGGPPRLPMIPPTLEAKAEIEEAFADLRS
ncbi:MAG: dihydrodipicolinate synthase family protein [Acidobacteriaceae bacterium]|nr:dihydrodipicolinate synthase family protein [Acidobacteriaceae bacterium]MBV9502518.1 dihydrodipicolinate synthase family protein [Acidobacteriaceae bacterium]